MPVVEQSILIKAPMRRVMAALNDVAAIPNWASVEGTIENIQGQGVGMTYNWHYSVADFSFSGTSEVIEQTESMLITKTYGDVNSLWTINLNSVGAQMTALRVSVEYTPAYGFVEVLADLFLQQLNNPEVAQENMNRFKASVESHTEQIEEHIIVSS
ncbi:MAG: SRPBCC family protein [Anaerolineales bacterium]|nr:SRPBCC family protein [Anaerolineales bacterium]